MERLKRVPETNIESTGSFFQNEVLDGLLRFGVEVGAFRRDGRQFHSPLWHPSALGQSARKPEEAPHQLKNYVL